MVLYLIIYGKSIPRNFRVDDLEFAGLPAAVRAVSMMRRFKKKEILGRSFRSRIKQTGTHITPERAQKIFSPRSPGTATGGMARRVASKIIPRRSTMFASTSTRGGDGGGGCSNICGGDGRARKDILSQSWSEISNEYDRILVPRFAPWTRDALDALRDAMSKSATGGYGKDEDDTTANARGGPAARGRSALVLCCGPGQELLPVAKILGRGSKVLGTDLAPGMVDLSRRRIETELLGEDDGGIGGYDVTVEVGDAMMPPSDTFDVIFSAFGLQQLPRPLDAIWRGWM